MLDRRDNLLQLLTPAAPRIVTAPAARSAAAAKPGAALSAAGRAAVGATLFKPRPAILARAPISLVSSLRNARTAATPAATTPPAPSFNLEAWLATARVYWDPEDAATRVMSGSDLVSLASKGTLGALLAKVISGGAVLGTLGGRTALDATNLRLDARNAADVANVAAGSIFETTASCFVWACRFPAAGNRTLCDEAGGYIASITGAPAANFYDAAGLASGPALADGVPGIVSVRHDGASLVVGLNGVEGTPVACGAIGGLTGAYRAIRNVTGLVGKFAIWNVPLPTDYAAGIAAMKTLYAIP